MKKYFMIQKEICSESIGVRFDEKYDICVIGLGTAGAIAVIAAAKKGLKVLGIEKSNYMGGVGTGGGIHSYYYGSTGGMQTEIDRETMTLSRELAGNNVKGFHPEAKKVALENQAKEAGAIIQYSATVLAVYRESNVIVGFQLKTPEGIFNIASKYVIDCSGEGDFSVLAGAKFSYGRAYNKEAQPYSAPRTYVMKDGKINGANFDAGYVDTKDATAYSEAIIKGHALHLRDFFTKDDRYVCLSPHLGIREGRFIEGEDKLTFENFIFNKSVNKPVMELYAHHDTHSSDFAFESKLVQDWVVVCGLWSKTITGGLPLGAFIPKDLKGLLVAGRCMSMDHDASQTFRMQRDMQKAGEIASIIASTCIQKNIVIEDLNYDELLVELKEKNLFPKKWLNECEPITDLEKIKRCFMDLSTGFTVWSCQLLGDEIEPHLLDWLESNDKNLSSNAAFALALRGNRICLPKLRQLIKNKDMTVFNGSHKLCPFYISAIYLAGQFGDLEAVEDIKSIFVSPDVKSFDDVTISALALKAIADKNAPRKKQIYQFVKDIILQANFQLPLDLQGNNAGLKKTRLNRGELLKELIA